MNPYALLVLLALLACFALEVAADLLNLRALSPAVPAAMAHRVDGERYARAQEYARAKARFALVERTFDLVLLLAFWAADGFGQLDRAVRGLGFGDVGTGLAYIGSLLLAKWFLGLPFSWYGTFRLEERFGFNRTDTRTFWADRAKGLVLAALLGAPLLASILFFFERTGESAWLWCWGITALFLLFIQFVAPTWIFPLFNKFQPLGEGPLREQLLAYAGKVGFPLRDVYVIDGSRRSTKANAFFSGFGRNKRVALFDTLIEKHAPAELVAIVAHEVGHFRLGHIVRMLAVGIAQTGALFFLLSLVLGHTELYEAFGVPPSTWVGLVVFGLVYEPLDMLLSAFVLALSRRHEFEADRFARETIGSSEELVTALERLSADHLDNLTPHPFYVALHHSHPPLLSRVRALRA